MFGLLIGFCALLGLVVGSFLERRHLPGAKKRVDRLSSFLLPACGATIRERDNIPVVSWLVLRGRCRDCRAPISARYPLVELACAGLFAGTAARFGQAWDLPAYLVLFAGLLALSCIDVERMLLPKKIVYPLTVSGCRPLGSGRGRDREVARLRSRRDLRRGMVRCVLRYELCQSTTLGLRGRTTFVGARSLVGMAGCWLRPTRILCGECHRSRDRNHPDRNKTNGTPESDSLRSISGGRMRRGGLRRPRAATALHSAFDLRAIHASRGRAVGLTNELHAQALLVPLRIHWDADGSLGKDPPCGPKDRRHVQKMRQSCTSNFGVRRS